MVKTNILNPKKLLIFALALLAGFLVMSFKASNVEAANENGYGWAIAARNIDASGVSCGGSYITSYHFFIKNADTGSLVTAGIRVADPLDPGWQQTALSNNVRIDCMDVNRGVWISVWGLSSYLRWDNSVPFNGLNEQYNFCCGLKSLDPGVDNGKVVYYNIFLKPSGGYTIQAASSTGTGLPGTSHSAISDSNGDGQLDYNVPLNINGGATLPSGSGCGGGSQIINRYIWLRNLTTGAQILGPGGSAGDGNVDGFGFIIPPKPIGSSMTYNINLPVGQYQWYAQYHENGRNCGNIGGSIPITSQFPWQFFTVTPGCTNTGTGTNRLIGCFWDGVNFNIADGTAPSGPVLSAPVPDNATALNQNWGGAAPNAFVGGDTFSARWKGNFTFKAGTYTFYAGADDGVRLRVDGVTRVNSWKDTGWYETGDRQVNVTFASQAVHNIEMDYYQNGGGSQASLRWALVTLPNLTVSDSNTSPVVPVVGDNVSFSGTVLNNGSVASVASQTRLSLDLNNDGVFETNISPDNPTGVLAVNGTEVETWSDVWIATAGTRRYQICADATSTNTESDETDNCRRVLFTVAAAGPDFITKDLVVNGSLVVGQALTFSGRARNQGLAADTGNNEYDGRFCIGNASCLTLPGTSRVGTDQRLLPRGLAVNTDSNLLTTNGTWTPATPGSYTVYFCADANTDILESDETNNCSSITFTIAAAQPDYDVTSVTVEEPLPMIVGSNYTFRATVVNDGDRNAPTDGSGRFCVFTSAVTDQVAALNCYERPSFAPPLVPGYNPPRRLPNDDLPFIPFNPPPPDVNNRTIFSSPDFWTATGADVKITFCADVRQTDIAPIWGRIGEGSNNIIGVPESSLTLQQAADDNCHSSPVFAISTNNSWLQTTDGDVGSIGEIKHPVDAPLTNASYALLVRSIAGVFDSAKSWVINPYNPNNTVGVSYTDFASKFTSGAAPLSGNSLPSDDRTYAAGNFNWSGGFTGGACTTPPPVKPHGTLIFIAGDLNIQSGTNAKTAPSDCNVVIVVSGVVTVDSAVTQIDATIVSFGRFITLTGGAANDPRLFINGSVISNLAASGSGPAFRRNLADNTPSAELITYQPEVLWYLSTRLGSSGSDYREINP